jgi:hypothetical protein
LPNRLYQLPRDLLEGRLPQDLYGAIVSLQSIIKRQFLLR